MMMIQKTALASLVAATLVLAGCESVDDKADRLYIESVELADAGEQERAIITLKSVFKLDGEHRDARMLYANLKRESGDLEEAYGHYLLVTEQYPEDFDARRALAEIAVQVGNWDEVERHATVAQRLQPEDTEIQSVMNVVAYRAATNRNDAAAIEVSVASAEDILAADPQNRYARQIVVDSLIRKQDFYGAIESLDRGLAVTPDNAEFNQIKLSLLAQLNDVPALGDHLRTMVELFPENIEIRSALVRWYLATGDADGAENFVRELVAKAGDEVPPRVSLVQFLAQVRDYESALEELETLIAEGLDNDTFTMMQASLIYDNRDRNEGIAIMESLIAGSEGGDPDSNMQTTLARMLIGVNEQQRAREIVDQVLEEDKANVDALKLKSNWLIDDDQVRDAILALRTALDQAPRDSEAITLLARAYERDGNRELMAESLALAVEASSNAAPESIRYANYLIQNEKYLSAEDVLLNGLRTSPASVELLRMLGQVYVALSDWPRTEQVIEALERLDTPQAKSVATGLQATVLQGMERTDESIDLLRNVIAEGQPGLAAQAAIIRTHLSNGEIAPARAYMDELLVTIEGQEPSPATDGLQFLNAALLAVEGNFAAASDIYADLAERNQTQEAVWRAYSATLIRQGRSEQAEAVVDEALQVLPENPNLLWVKAGLREQAGDVDSAIDIYEGLYEANSNSTIVANNLASLITTYRDDEESLQRAYRIARRLRGLEVPALQDTYGWIAYRLGNLQEAVEHLEPAAKGLPNDPSVQYHLAKAYISLGRSEEAVPYLETAVEAWQATGNPRLEDAVEELTRLTSPSVTGATATDGN
jgi:tetratricopeptide (TPR) repeat protein